MKFFAEGLPRLGVVNLNLQLEPPSNGYSLSTIEGDHHARLRRGDEAISIPLPLAASSTETFTYSNMSSIVTTRISAARSKSSSEPQPLLSASDFQEQPRVLCASCRRQILKLDPIRWKDLPSENWIEFSDYWLCHPGHSHSLSHSHSHHIQENKSHQINPIPILKPTPGTSLLGLTFVLVDSSDTQNITIKVTLPDAYFGLKESISLSNTGRR
jgi:HECT-like Ubiquitin-conjugating enzyme (E2)-binding